MTSELFCRQVAKELLVLWRLSFIGYIISTHAGVKIRKHCQGSFGPCMSYFWGPAQYPKGPDFLISLIGLITVSLLPQNCPPSLNFEGPQAILGAIGPRARLILTPGHTYTRPQKKKADALYFVVIFLYLFYFAVPAGTLTVTTAYRCSIVFLSIRGLSNCVSIPYGYVCRHNSLYFSNRWIWINN